MTTLPRTLIRLAAIGAGAGALAALAIIAPASAASPANTNLVVQLCSDETHVDLTWRFEGEDALPADATYEVASSLLTDDGVTASGGTLASIVEQVPGATLITLVDVPTVDHVLALVVVTSADDSTILASVAGDITADCTAPPVEPVEPVEPTDGGDPADPVQDVPTEQPGQALASTGSASVPAPLVLGGVGLLGIGGAALVLHRRRA